MFIAILHSMKKHLCICTADTDYYSIERFKEEAELLKIPVDIIPYADIYVSFDTTQINLSAHGNDLRAYSHFIFRHSKYMHAIRQLMAREITHAKILNKKLFTDRKGGGKLTKSIALLKAGIPIIPTRVAQTRNILKETIHDMLAMYSRLIIKPSMGTHGKGIHIIDVTTDLDKLPELNEVYLVQPFIQAEFDVRILVLGGQIIGVTQRKTNQYEFHPNYSTRTEIQAMTLSEDVLQHAVNAAQELGMEYAGVDMIFDEKNNPYILEVNSSPEFQDEERYSGLNIARKILEHLLK